MELRDDTRKRGCGWVRKEAYFRSFAIALKGQVTCACYLGWRTPHPRCNGETDRRRHVGLCYHVQALHQGTRINKKVERWRHSKSKV